MEKVSKITGAAAPLMLANVDTDLIIRIERLTSVPREQLGPYAFEALRYRDDGSDEPAFVLNQAAFKNAPILLAGANFGCGSSREGAVSALWGSSIRCVIAESFGDIFRNNCFQNGLLPVQLSAAELDVLSHDAAGGASVTVDLDRQTVTAPQGQTFQFDIEPLRRNALLQGLDEIGQTMLRESEIAAWQHRDSENRPWIWALTPGLARTGGIAREIG